MNKKFGALLLALAMTMALAACGGEKAEATPAPSAEATTEATPAPEKTAEPTKEAETPAPTAEATVEPTAEATAEPEKTAEPAATAAVAEKPVEATPAPEKTPEPTPEPAASVYKDGTYTASAKGFGGDVVATVTINGDAITNVTLTGDSETPGIGGAALDTLAANAKAKGADMDGVSGASLTSAGAKEAVSAALAQAKN